MIFLTMMSNLLKIKELQYINYLSHNLVHTIPTVVIQLHTKIQLTSYIYTSFLFTILKRDHTRMMVNLNKEELVQNRT